MGRETSILSSGEREVFLNRAHRPSQIGNLRVLTALVTNQLKLRRLKYKCSSVLLKLITVGVIITKLLLPIHNGTVVVFCFIFVRNKKGY